MDYRKLYNEALEKVAYEQQLYEEAEQEVFIEKAAEEGYLAGYYDAMNEVGDNSGYGDYDEFDKIAAEVDYMDGDDAFEMMCKEAADDGDIGMVKMAFDDGYDEACEEIEVFCKMAEEEGWSDDEIADALWQEAGVCEMEKEAAAKDSILKKIWDTVTFAGMRGHMGQRADTMAKLQKKLTNVSKSIRKPMKASKAEMAAAVGGGSGIGMGKGLRGASKKDIAARKAEILKRKATRGTNIENQGRRGYFEGQFTPGKGGGTFARGGSSTQQKMYAGRQAGKSQAYQQAAAARAAMGAQKGQILQDLSKARGKGALREAWGGATKAERALLGSLAGAGALGAGAGGYYAYNNR